MIALSRKIIESESISESKDLKCSILDIEDDTLGENWHWTTIQNSAPNTPKL
jgi:hypothetical protein